MVDSKHFSAFFFSCRYFSSVPKRCAVVCLRFLGMLAIVTSPVKKAFQVERGNTKYQNNENILAELLLHEKTLLSEKVWNFLYFS
jgi:hypothetical protein